MATYRTYGPVPQGVALQAQMQADATRAQTNQHLIDLFGSVVTGAMGLPYQMKQAQTEADQKAAYLKIAQQQADSLQQQRDLNAAKVIMENPDLGEIVKSTAYGQYLSKKFGWDQPGGLGPVPDGGVPPLPKMLPTTAGQPQFGAAAGNVVNRPTSLPLPGPADIAPGEVYAPAPGTPGYQTQDASGANLAAPPQTAGPSMWDKLATMGRQRRAGAVLGAAAQQGEGIAAKVPVTGVPSAVAGVDNTFDGYVAAVKDDPETVALLNAARERLKKAIPDSPANALLLGLRKLGMEGMNPKQQAQALSKQLQAVGSMRSFAQQQAQAAALAGDGQARDGFLGRAQGLNAEYQQLAGMLQQVMGGGADLQSFLQTGKLTTTLAGPPGTPQTSPAPPSPKVAAGTPTGQGKAPASPVVPSKGPGATPGEMTFPAMDMQTGADVAPSLLTPPTYGAPMGQLNEQQQLSRDIASGKIAPGSPEWNSAPSRLWVGTGADKATAAHVAVGQRMAGAIKALGKNPGDQQAQQDLLAAQQELATGTGGKVAVPSETLRSLIVKTPGPVKDAADKAALLEKKWAQKPQDDLKAQSFTISTVNKATGQKFTLKNPPSIDVVLPLMKSGAISPPGQSNASALMSFDQLPLSVQMAFWQRKRDGMLGWLR